MTATVSRSVGFTYSISSGCTDAQPGNATPPPAHEPAIFDELIKIALSLGLAPPGPGESPYEYGARVRDHLNDQLPRLYVARERVLALLHE